MASNSTVEQLIKRLSWNKSYCIIYEQDGQWTVYWQSGDKTIPSRHVEQPTLELALTATEELVRGFYKQKGWEYAANE